MKRMVMMVLAMLIPIATTAGAQMPAIARDSSSVGTGQPVAGATGSPPGVEALKVESQRRPEGQLPRPRALRRRGSMVGYIDDAVVESKVRVRFEFGLHTDRPDRAEFFYGKCGCYRDLPTNAAAYDPDAAGPGPGIVTDLNFQQIYVQGEYAVTDQFSVFGEATGRRIQPQAFSGGGPRFSDHSGIGDVRAGLKLALIADAEQVATAQVKTFLPSGEARNGLGTGHVAIEPAVLYYRQISDRAAVESQVGVWVPFGGSHPVPTAADGNFSGNVLFYGIGPSYEIYRSGSARFAPVMELIGWHVLSGNQTGGTADATGTNIVNLKLGGRFSWAPSGSIYVGWGHALTNAVWYEDIVRFEYRYSF